MGLERLWAGWRSEYVSSATAEPEIHDSDDTCVMCRVLRAETQVVWRGDRCAAVLNAYPYTSGHLLVVPARHLGDLEELDADEGAELWSTVGAAVAALRAAYSPDGVNLGANLGEAAGAGVPGHLHVHVLPRWVGDTNFMTTVAEARVMPEPLSTTFEKLKAKWPA